jgi:hypothetical protein
LTLAGHECGRAAADLNPSGGFSLPIIKARACNAQPSIGPNQLMKLSTCVGGLLKF